MCSIEEAWAGQTFDGKKVVSQGDFHNNYMSLPDTILNRNNEITIKKTNQEPVKNLPRGVNSKYSREPRVPKIVRNSTVADINISSEMPESNNYGGLEQLPSFMSIYNNNNNNNNNQPQSNYSYPMPTTTGDHFTDIENAYKVSDSLSKYMTTDTSNKYMNTDTSNKYMNTDNSNTYMTTDNSNTYMNTDNSNTYMNTEPNLLNEDTEEESNIINNKFTNKNRNTNSFKNYSNSNSNLINDPEIKLLLNTIIKKIDSIESQLSNCNNKNIYDLILYIIIGILVSFCIYSIFAKTNKL